MTMDTEFVAAAGSFFIACTSLIKAYLAERESKQIKDSRAVTKLERDEISARQETRIALLKQRQEQMEIELAEQRGANRMLPEIMERLKGIENTLCMIVDGKINVGHK